jgi:hypothetical protein
MDGLVTAILSGIIVALVGAIAAYYFGVRQERLKQAYQQQRDEREDKEEAQRQLNEIGANVLDQMRPQIALLAETYTSWVEVFAKLLSTPRPPTPEQNKKREEEQSVVAFLTRPLPSYDSQTILNEAQVVLDKRDEIAQLVNSLRDFYWHQRPSLPDKTRNLLESFFSQLQRHHSALSGVAKEFTPLIKSAAEHYRKRYRHRYSFYSVIDAPNYIYHGQKVKDSNEEIAERIQQWRKDVESAQN